MSLLEALKGARVSCCCETCSYILIHYGKYPGWYIVDLNPSLSCAGQVELAAIPSPAGKLHRLVGITRTFAEELVQQLMLAPYAFRALRTYRSLPRLECSAYSRPNGVSIMKDLRQAEG